MLRENNAEYWLLCYTVILPTKDIKMATYIVRHYYVVEVEVEADSTHDALEMAGAGDTEYNVSTAFVDGSGGPSIDWVNEEVYEIDSVA